MRAAADDDAAGVGADGELLGLVAVGHEDEVAGLDGLLHHLGRGAHAQAAGRDALLGVAEDHLAVKGGDDVGVLGLGTAEDLDVEDVEVGVGDVLGGDEAEQVVGAVGDREGVGLGLAHDAPGLEQARLGVDAALLLDLGVLDLRGHGGDQRGLGEAEVLEREGGLAVDGAGAAGLVDVGVAGLVLEVGVGDRRADAVGVGVEVANDVDLADCLGHSSSKVRADCESFPYSATSWAGFGA